METVYWQWRRPVESCNLLHWKSVGGKVWGAHKVQMMTLPPKSPNITPIKHQWDVLDKQVWSMEPTHLTTYKNLLLTSSCQMPQHSLFVFSSACLNKNCQNCFGSKSRTYTIWSRWEYKVDYCMLLSFTLTLQRTFNLSNHFIETTNYQSYYFKGQSLTSFCTWGL